MSNRAILEAAFERAAGDIKEALTEALSLQAELFDQAIGKTIKEASLCLPCATSFKAALNRALDEISQKDSSVTTPPGDDGPQAMPRDPRVEQVCLSCEGRGGRHTAYCKITDKCSCMGTGSPPHAAGSPGCFERDLKQAGKVFERRHLDVKPEPKKSQKD